MLKREPKPGEVATALKYLGQTKPPEEAAKNLVWALVNTTEFTQMHGIATVMEANEIAEIISRKWEKK